MRLRPDTDGYAHRNYRIGMCDDRNSSRHLRSIDAEKNQKDRFLDRRIPSLRAKSDVPDIARNTGDNQGDKSRNPGRVYPLPQSGLRPGGRNHRTSIPDRDKNNKSIRTIFLPPRPRIRREFFKPLHRRLSGNLPRREKVPPTTKNDPPCGGPS